MDCLRQRTTPATTCFQHLLQIDHYLAAERTRVARSTVHVRRPERSGRRDADRDQRTLIRNVDDYTPGLVRVHLDIQLLARRVDCDTTVNRTEVERQHDS